HPESRAEDIVHRKTGELAHPLRHRLPLLGADRIPLLESEGVRAAGEVARLLDEACERRLVRDLAVVPGVSRVGRKEIDQRLAALESGGVTNRRHEGAPVER